MSRLLAVNCKCRGPVSTSAGLGEVQGECMETYNIEFFVDDRRVHGVVFSRDVGDGAQDTIDWCVETMVVLQGKVR